MYRIIGCMMYSIGYEIFMFRMIIIARMVGHFTI